MNKRERTHITACGDRFRRAHSAAAMVVWRDSHLIGLDTVRAPLAFWAAMKGTGYESARYVPPPVPPGGPTDFYDVVSKLFDRAADAARNTP